MSAHRSHDQLVDPHRASFLHVSAAGLSPSRLLSSSRHSSAAFLVITAYTPPAPGSRHASKVSPRQPGQMLNENSGNAARSRTSSVLIHGGAPGLARMTDHPASASPSLYECSGPAAPAPSLSPGGVSSVPEVMSRSGPGSVQSRGTPGTNGARTRPGPGSTSRPSRPAGTGGTSSRGLGRPGSYLAGHRYCACRHDLRHVVTNQLHLGFSQ